MVDHADLLAKIDRLNETNAALRDNVSDLEDELERIRLDWYSPEAHDLHLRNELESVEDCVRYEYRRSLGPITEDAHRVLSDLAWRATTGDTIAAAVEAEVADLLRRIRDTAA